MGRDTTTRTERGVTARLRQTREAVADTLLCLQHGDLSSDELRAVALRLQSCCYDLNALVSRLLPARRRGR